MSERACASCGRGTIPPSRWRTQRELRPMWKAAGIRQGAGRGLCRPCYVSLWKRDGLDPFVVRTPTSDTCAADDCDSPTPRTTYCNRHQKRLRARGSLELRAIDPAASFWARVDQGPSCWVWTGAATNGYGVVKWAGRNQSAHRVAHILAIGPIPEGFQVDHVRARGCTETLCVNPAHLEAVTPRENNYRSTSPAAINKQRTECINGHPFDDANTYLRLDRPGTRECRTCARDRDAASRCA